MKINKFIISLYILFILLYTLQFSLAGTIDGTNYNLILRSRELTPSKNFNLLTLIILQLKHRDSESFHFYIQFDKMPDIDEKKFLESKGIKLVEYLNANTWIVSIKTKDISKISDIKNIRWIGEIQPEDKMENRVLYKKFREDIVEGDNVRLLLDFYKNAEISECRSTISRYGDILENFAPRAFILSLPTDSLYGLANEDCVRVIEQAPPPTINNIDGSRATIGANAVQASPYGLNGTGIVAAMWEAIYGGGYKVNKTHRDLSGRVTYGDSGTATSQHATAVAGVMAGGGNITLNLRGVATKLNIISFDQIGEINEHQNAINSGSRISQNSWSYNTSLM